MNAQYLKSAHIARIVCLVLVAFGDANGDGPTPAWADLDDSERNRRITIVEAIRDDIALDAPGLHQQWIDRMTEGGWVFGRPYDLEAKAHPLLKPFADLPKAERIRIALQVGTIRALLGEA